MKLHEVKHEHKWMIQFLDQTYGLPAIHRAFQDLEQPRLPSLSPVSTRSSASPSNHHHFSRPNSAPSQYQTPGGSSCTSSSDPLNSGYATCSSTLAPTSAPIFPSPPGAEQTLDYNALPDQVKLDFPAAQALLIPNASGKLFFCTYAAEKGKTELFGSKSDWKKHEMNFHETGKEYRCSDPSCSQTFSREYDYNQHCKRHGNLNVLPASKMMRKLSQKTAFGCGFNHCKTVSYSWKERCDHVADHMKKEGKTPSDWSYSNVIRNLSRQQKQNIREIWKIMLDQFCQRKKIDRSRLYWLPSNTRELRQNLECGIFYPNVEVFVQKAMDLSSLGTSESPNQATALLNRSIIPSQDSVQSADTPSLPQIQDFLMADSADFDGSTQFDPSQQASQLQLPFENQPQLPLPHNMDFSISHSPNYEHDPDRFYRTQSEIGYLNIDPMLTPDSFYQTQSEFGYPNIDPMLTEDSLSQPSQILAESNLDSQIQYQQNNFPEYSNQEQHMHPLEHYYEPLPQPPTNPGRFIMNGLRKLNSNLSSRKPQCFQPVVNSEETVPSLPIYSRMAALGFNSTTSSFHPGNHNGEVTDFDDGVYKP